MVVVLPAPLGPRRPRVSPEWTEKETPSTTLWVEKDLTRFSTRIISWESILLAEEDIIRYMLFHLLFSNFVVRTVVFFSRLRFIGQTATAT